MMSSSSAPASNAASGVPAASSAAPVVSVRGLVKNYGEVQALRGVDFDVPAGSVLGFLGPNGAGKTTAIKILCGYLAADAGTVTVCGLNVASHALQVKQRIGYLPENNPVYTDMRVEDFLRFAARARRLRGKAVQQGIDRVVVQTGLAEVYRRSVGQCSKGFRQRVGLAQALIHDPELLVLDEPTNGLDPLQVVEMRALIRELGQTKTVMITSHVLPEIEALADNVVLIHQGEKVADGPLETIAAEHGGRLPARCTIACSEEQLQELLKDCQATFLDQRHASFASAFEQVQSAMVEVDGPEGLAALAKTAAAKGYPILELTPMGGSLESLFQSLRSGGQT
ncbi:MAG: ABC transporter ATP-binding protein [Planctomycetes bacterium]|nr:ABC transporter ATP-binding protein [Planctomycetota bacterium]MCP4771715.1 ABC transporter ATP-binding protein [Planctomycetota bacterium]MCP4859985.1 ABC transporter ATP-binding protein [Planctomycetota bacterium]